MTIIANRIRSALMLREMRETELAEKTGVSLAMVSKWVNAKQLPNANSIIELSKALDVSADYLLGLSKKAERDE